MARKHKLLVYQMGKVGSRSIERTLTSLGYDPLHLHHLNPHTRAAMAERNRRRGRPPPPGRLALQVDRLLKRGKLDIVTLVRDPVARNISAYFENLQVFVGPAGNRLGALAARLAKAVARRVEVGQSLSEYLENLYQFGPGTHSFDKDQADQLIRSFLEDYNHLVPLTWFDSEMKSVIGLDVYREPFPWSDGWSILDDARARVLILRSEATDQVKSVALAHFLGLQEPPSIRRANIGAKKSYRDIYTTFRQQIQLPQTYLDTMYESKFAKHFYGQEELRSFRAKWSRLPGDHL